jgi:predicted XRE-type DNA-binding protein
MGEHADEPAEYMTVGEARDYLGVSKPKISQLIRDQILHVEIDPLNRRFKWIRRAEVEALKAQQKKVAA